MDVRRKNIMKQINFKSFVKGVGMGLMAGGWGRNPMSFEIRFGGGGEGIREEGLGLGGGMGSCSGGCGGDGVAMKRAR